MPIGFTGVMRLSKSGTVILLSHTTPLLIAIYPNFYTNYKITFVIDACKFHPFIDCTISSGYSTNHKQYHLKYLSKNFIFNSTQRR